jgi:hypothetical protein
MFSCDSIVVLRDPDELGVKFVYEAHLTVPGSMPEAVKKQLTYQIIRIRRDVNTHIV